MKTLMLVGSILCGLTLAISFTWAGRRNALANAGPNSSANRPFGGETGWQIVRISYHSRAELERLTARLDIWEVYPENHTVVARISAEEVNWLASEGYTVITQPSPPRITAPSAYDCYRTISQLYADEDSFASTYPTLTEIITIGASYEGRPLRVVKLTNKNKAVPTFPKPRFFLMANIHGREFITPETAMQFIQQLLEGYNRNPDLTWLLDWREVHVLVSANPDGHVHNEGTFTYWRKNANPANQASCNPSYGGYGEGTDLNRNSSFAWGGDGSSDQVCDETYRGIAPASDLETQVIQNYVASLFPDRRGPLITPAAMTTTGILVTLHSYSNLVLWPWGYTYNAAPNAAQLAALGQKLASYNNYTAQPASSFYPASGTTDDWSYGELGIASYTFEIGGGADGFLPSCDRYTALIQPNLDALIYAARAASAPYQLAAGPDTLSLTLGVFTGTVTITATVTAGQAISSAEAYVDTPPWIAGTAISLAASDGTFDYSTEIVSGTLSISEPGHHIVFVRGQDVSGDWGAVAYATFDEPWPRALYLPIVVRD